jgi:predicted O-methyltransferase YrrM
MSLPKIYGVKWRQSTRGMRYWSGEVGVHRRKNALRDRGEKHLRYLIGNARKNRPIRPGEGVLLRFNMSNATHELINLDTDLNRHNEGRWALPYDSNIKGFSSFNDAGVECEVGEFLYSMVRMLKPKFVLETGTHHGVGASYIGMALKENGEGVCHTFEFLPENHIIASKRIGKLGLSEFVKCGYGDIRAFTPDDKYGLILLDTEPQTRFMEFEKFWDSLEQGGYIFIHDLHRHMHQIPNDEHGFAWPFGEVTEFMKQKVKLGEARPFHFSNPRGFTGFYKVSPDDYKWGKNE